MIVHTTVTNALLESRAALDALLSDEKTLKSISSAGEQLIASFRSGGRVFACGNGGSMCDAIHFAEELSGRYRDDRKGLPAVAIADPGHLSCVGNDYGYEFVFSRYLQAHARQGDVLVGISTSGKSINVIKAAEYAQCNGMMVITLTGNIESPISSLATIDICTPAGKYADRVQELHIKVIHILIELVERDLFPENYN
jgi:D-sedoheptulose 7-phosphate isomerase